MNNISVEKINSVLESVRPFLAADGGDVEFVNVSPEGIVEVRLLGACFDCPLSQMTLRAGIERALLNEIPEIRRVEAIT